MSLKDGGETWHSVREAAELLRLSEAAVRKLISRGRLTARKLGASLLIPESSLSAFEKKPKGWPHKKIGS